MPALRRKKRRYRKRNGIKNKFQIKYLFVLLFLLFVAAGILGFLQLGRMSDQWSGDEKLAIAVDNGEEGVVVVLLDPIHNEIHKFYYPENLQVEAARNLGSWKIGSLWELGEDEGVGGMLLAHTVTKSLRTPVTSWSGPRLLTLLEKGYMAIPMNVFSSPASTNLSLSDKIGISRFSASVEDSKVTVYTHTDLRFLSEQKLNDGTDGYVINRDPSTKILTLFSNEYLRSRPNRTLIISSTENNWKAKQLGEVLEVTGVKIAAIRSEAHEVHDCEISSSDEKMGEILSRYFSCTHNTKTSTNFDIEIRIGDDFVERF